MIKLTIPYSFTPRDYQVPIFKAIDSWYKRIIQVRHRRAWKEKTDINIVAKKMLEKVWTYYYVFPTYTQWRKILRDWIDKSGFKFTDHIPKELRESTNNQEMKIELKTWSIFQVVWTDRIDTIVWTNPIWVIFSEYSLQNPLARDYVRPILAENWWWAIFNFTPRGENHAFDLLQFALEDDTRYTSVLTVDDTKAIPKEVLEQERKEIIHKNWDDAIFQQEYYCSFEAAIQWAYYGELMKQAKEEWRITRLPYEHALWVYTARDLWMSDSTSIWFFQVYWKEIRLIDYYENQWESLEHYVNVLKEKWYRYNDHFLPHDVEVRELSSWISRKQTLYNLWLSCTVVPQMNIMDWINAVRAILKYCWFDKEKCDFWIKALRNYHKDYDEKAKTYRKTPKHDWSSHWADSFRYLAAMYLMFANQHQESAVEVDFTSYL